MTDPLLLTGDCKEQLLVVAAKSVNLVMTSPPYADRRAGTYGGIHPDEYVDWFLPRAEQFKRVLKPDGSFILNIKENVVDGERHTYVHKLIDALRDQGWRWVEEYCWHKKNAAPGKWPNRFRDSWERCYHFALNKKFKMNQDSVRVPIGKWAKGRLDKEGGLSEGDLVRRDSVTGSGVARRVGNWVGRDTVYPGNVLHLAAEAGCKGHSAVFPVSLPRWFIRLFTDKEDLETGTQDVVLDPFSGSGTTGVACRQLGRSYIGIDIHSGNNDIALQRWRATAPNHGLETSDEAAPSKNVVMLEGAGADNPIQDLFGSSEPEEE